MMKFISLKYLTEEATALEFTYYLSKQREKT